MAKQLRAQLCRQQTNRAQPKHMCPSRRCLHTQHSPMHGSSTLLIVSLTPPALQCTDSLLGQRARLAFFATPCGALCSNALVAHRKTTLGPIVAPAHKLPALDAHMTIAPLFAHAAHAQVRLLGVLHLFALLVEQLIGGRMGNVS